MTSNAGAQNIISPKKFGFLSADDANADYKRMKDGVMEEVKNIFKPEFINRIDEIIVFRQLSKQNLSEIACLMLNEVALRCREQMNLKVKTDETTVRFLLEKGSDDKYGARPLRRAIQTYVEDTMAEEVLSGKIGHGDSVTIIAEENKIRFKVRKMRKSAKKNIEDSVDNLQTEKNEKS
jgi:ATP-dependent Clp protease ATP-binding subunit ClpC